MEEIAPNPKRHLICMEAEIFLRNAPQLRQSSGLQEPSRVVIGHLHTHNNSNESPESLSGFGSQTQKEMQGNKKAKPSLLYVILLHWEELDDAKSETLRRERYSSHVSGAFTSVHGMDEECEVEEVGVYRGGKPVREK